ncbi:hypothetical protein ACN38_g9316 [Penicillium nordicum]|uniref:Uncharacterized protein n=1 Tax=Penicillium nordicum TaxID=229535 RepID=A0A0M9WCZ6_9EURO|nr:hypothetical protein ACN38_g9316 [Penicillium nordicum]
MKRIVEASDKCTWEPYLTHNRFVNLRTLPFRGLIDLSSRMAQSVKYRFKAVSLNGTDVVCVEGEGKQRLSLCDIKAIVMSAR